MGVMVNPYWVSIEDTFAKRYLELERETISTLPIMIELPFSFIEELQLPLPGPEIVIFSSHLLVPNR